LIDYYFLLIPEKRLVGISIELSHGAFLLGSGGRVANVVLQHLVAVPLFNNFSFFKLTQRGAQDARFKVKVSHFAVETRGQKNVAIETPTQVSHAHHAEVHNQGEGFG